MCQRWVRQEHGTVTYRNLERFQAKWIPVRVKKTRQNKKIEPRSDSIGTERALGARVVVHQNRQVRHAIRMFKQPVVHRPDRCLSAIAGT